MRSELQANETILFLIEAEISLGDRVRSLNLEGPGTKSGFFLHLKVLAELICASD